jgi:DnaA family protein
MMNKQLALAIQLNDEATLSNFNWHNNSLLKQQLEVMLAFKNEKLLYLWGNHGSGKSHILQGCCQAINTTESAIYLPLNLLKEWGPEAIEGIEDQALICIDDIDAIAANRAWEEALFHLYNRIKDSEQGILIIAGTYAPTTSTIQLPDLRSRLSWGLVMQLHELNDEEKVTTLKQLATQRGFDLPDTVGQFLINRYSRNMHDLHQLLDLLDKTSLQAQRKITIPFVKEILNSHPLLKS